MEVVGDMSCVFGRGPGEDGGVGLGGEVGIICFLTIV